MTNAWEGLYFQKITLLSPLHNVYGDDIVKVYGCNVPYMGQAWCPQQIPFWLEMFPL